MRTLDVADAYYGERASPLPESEADCDGAATHEHASGPLCHARFRLRGVPQAFEPFEARLLASRDAADFRSRLGDLPEQYRLPDATTVAYRALFLSVANALSPGVSPRSREAVARLSALLASTRERVGLRLLERRYAGALEPAVSVVLVGQSPFPGIFASDGSHRGALARVDDDPCSLAETVLHEAVHSLAHQGSGSHVISALRDRLAAQGASGDDVEVADNALVFLGGEELARLLPGCEGHVGVATTGGFFEQAGRVARAVRDAWAPYTRGDISVQVALDRTITALASPD